MDEHLDYYAVGVQVVIQRRPYLPSHEMYDEEPGGLGCLTYAPGIFKIHISKDTDVFNAPDSFESGPAAKSLKGALMDRIRNPPVDGFELGALMDRYGACPGAVMRYNLGGKSMVGLRGELSVQEAHFRRRAAEKRRGALLLLRAEPVLSAESEIEFLEACEVADIADPLSLSGEDLIELTEGRIKVGARVVRHDVVTSLPFLLDDYDEAVRRGFSVVCVAPYQEGEDGMSAMPLFDDLQDKADTMAPGWDERMVLGDVPRRLEFSRVGRVGRPLLVPCKPVWPPSWDPFGRHLEES